MRFFLLLSGALLLAVGIGWRRRVRARQVSVRWLQDQDRSETTRGIDGVCWRWPYDRRKDDSGLWNRHVEQRRKAS